MNEKRSNVRWYFAIGFFLIGVIAYMDRSNISYIAAPMMKDLGMTKTQFGLLASFFSLGYAFMQVPSGMLSEKFGPRKMITIALVWWSAFTILTGVVKNHGLLYTMRFLFGAACVRSRLACLDAGMVTAGGAGGGTIVACDLGAAGGSRAAES